MSNDDKKLTDAEKKALHIENGKKAKTRGRWTPSYELICTAPERLLEKLDGDSCYGGEEVREDLRRQVQEQRAYPENISFEDWWLNLATWAKKDWMCAEATAWRKLTGEVNTACNPYLRKEQCIHRHVYRIKSRNLAFGAYNVKTNGFCGIREKFGRHYIFEEYHWDNESFATVQPQEDLGLLPDGIEAVETLGTETKAGRRVWFNREAAKPDGDAVEKLGGLCYVDTGDLISEEDRKGLYSIHNDALFEYLQRWDPVPAKNKT
jgi:hypothetical protein